MKRLPVFAAILMLALGLGMDAHAGGFVIDELGEGGKGVIPPPLLKPFTDNHDWMLAANLRYFIGSSGIAILVPEGFVTDFASIPEPLHLFGLSPHGKYSKAAIVHDYLYWSQKCTQKQADNLLLIAMQESKVSSFKEDVIYAGVRLGGQSSWESNASERKELLPRVIPKEYEEFPGDVTWEAYRKSLVSKQVRDPLFDPGVSYCGYGDSTKLP